MFKNQTPNDPINYVSVTQKDWGTKRKYHVFATDLENIQKSVTICANLKLCLDVSMSLYS